jgi:Trypsin-like peptidase domain
MADLSGKQIDELKRALSNALNFDDLERMVHIGTGDRLFKQYVAEGKPLNPTIADLLNALNERGIAEGFLAVVYRERPFKADLRSIILKTFPGIDQRAAREGPDFSVQTAGVAEAADAGPRGPGLQRNVRPNLAKLDLRVWGDRLDEVERRVCKVEIDGRALGTGFLVGPQVILTNWHVLREAEKAGNAGALGFRFDYRVLTAGGRDPGKLVNIDANGVVDFSPCSAAEDKADSDHPDQPPPTADELDYALLRLAQPAGAERGFVALPERTPVLEVGAPLIIVQHPDGSPLKLAIDTQSVIGEVCGGLRLRYKTNTVAGSSGSPCFTMDWDIAALHHLGDPASKAPGYNQGIPIALVRERLVKRGHGALIGV